MIDLDINKFNKIFESYKEDFTKHFPQERYKWIAVKHFQENWDIRAENFIEMLTSAMSKTDNLLASSLFFPLGMLQRFCETDCEKVRNMFISLFNEEYNLYNRIEKFIKDSDDILASRQNKGEGKNEKQHYQNLNSISTYLWLKYPNKYYIYKYTEISRAIEYLGVKTHIKKGLRKETVIDSLNLFNTITSLIKKDKEFSDIYNSILTPECYEDLNFHLVTIDFIFFINNYYQETYLNNINEETHNEEVFSVKEDTVNKGSDIRKWWLNANPSIWSAGIGWAVGSDIKYTILNDRGNKRRIYQNFIDIKSGDKVICYESTPTKQIVALAEVMYRNDEFVCFRKLRNFTNPIDYSDIKENPDLRDMEFFKNPNGSLFKLTDFEYDSIMDMAIDFNITNTISNIESYSENDFLNEVYMSKEDMNALEYLIRNKKNIILQGAPGVGKTFSAKRIAYKMMGCKDERRICMVQFHQNYSYEDFVLGYKPVENGFKLKEGIFYNFCIQASNDPTNNYFFIIDEINRGNLSKIFGELLMSIESSYRGTKIRLAYGDKELTVPDNLYIIGMMNTADRSLALIDYALRRRFSFFNMKPGFRTDGFINLIKSVNNNKFTRLVEEIQRLNQTIDDDASLGEGYEIGHSYFCKDGDINDTWLETLVKYDIIPMLKEYWFDNSDEVNKWSKILLEAIR